MRKIFYSALLVLLSVPVMASHLFMTWHTKTFLGNGTWTAPPGVNQIWVTGCGAGASGGSGAATYSGGGGGAAEFYYNVPVSVSSGTTYTVVVGQPAGSACCPSGPIGGGATYMYDASIPSPPALFQILGGDNDEASSNYVGGGGGGPFGPAKVTTNIVGIDVGFLTSTGTIGAYDLNLDQAVSSIVEGATGGGGGGGGNVGRAGGKFQFGGTYPQMSQLAGTGGGTNRGGGGGAGPYGQGGIAPTGCSVFGNEPAANSGAGGPGVCGTNYSPVRGASGQLTIRWLGP